MKLLAALIAVGWTSLASAQATWTVSASNPGADFADIQSAVDAASDFDTILVGAGDYDGFQIDAKSLYVVADDGEQVSLTDTLGGGQHVIVRSLPVGGLVVLRGIDVRIEPPVNVPSTGFYFFLNSGEIWIEDCEVEMYDPLLPFLYQHPGLRLNASPTVVVVGCSFRGGASAAGLLSYNSDVFVFESAFEGGPGASEQFNPFETHDGGRGVALITGTGLYASDSTFTGGDGYDSIPFSCEPPSDGGAGIGIGTSLFRDRSTVTVGGAAGLAAAGCSDPDGLPGLPIQFEPSATMEQYPEPARGVTANSPVREGEVSSQTYTGVPTELILSTIAFQLDPGVFFAEFAGPLLLGGSTFYRFCGLVPASGSRTKSFTVQELGLDSVTAFFHPFFMDLVTLEWRSGTPTAVTYLDGGF